MGGKPVHATEREEEGEMNSKTYPYQSSITREASERALAELEKMHSRQTMLREDFAKAIAPDDWHTAVKVIDDLAYLQRIIITSDHEYIRKA
jgi:hypothetical protein